MYLHMINFTMVAVDTLLYARNLRLQKTGAESV